jgi:hypothetical protein
MRLKRIIGVVIINPEPYITAMVPPVQQSRLLRIYRSFGDMKSENVGGLVSMAGSCLFLLGGDASGVVVSLSFLVAEIILARFGHRRVGYSSGCALFAFGDALAVTSEVASGNQAFQIALAIMAAAWVIGAVRAPLAWLGERLGRPAVIAAADLLQPIAGVATLTLRIPGMVTAIGGGNILGAVAVACWGTADILVGRLQDLYRRLAGPDRHLPRSHANDDTTLE